MKRPHQHTVSDSVDDARLLPHLRDRTRSETRAELRREQARALREALADQPDAALPTSVSTAAGDARKLRGIPATGRSVAGAVPGTAPHRDAPSLQDRDRAA